ncbi:MAG: hypothetical protein ACLSAF_12550 [Intestinimonas sp.]
MVAERGVTPFWGGSPTCARRPAWTRSSGCPVGRTPSIPAFSVWWPGVPSRTWDPASLSCWACSTQTYAQAIWSARSDSAARKGALLSALLIPPIGIACILIGLYMRAHYITTAEVQALAALGQAVPRGLRRWPPPLRLSPCLW